jgi:hypothetical protein
MHNNGYITFKDRKDMKIVKYISSLFAIALLFAACDKKEVELDFRPAAGMAQFQLHYMVPVTSGVSTEYIYRVDINDVNISNDQWSISTYNGQPGSNVGEFFVAQPGKNNIKLYQRVSSKDTLVYNQDATFTSGTQTVIVYDFHQPPIVTEWNVPENTGKSYDTDTIGYIKFHNLMFETPAVPKTEDAPEIPAVPTTLKLQYQFRYILHPLYTIADEMAGTIPEGKKVGNYTGDTKKSKWANLGPALAFGENTGWVKVPVKKSEYVTSGYATIDYRILVVEGGTVGVEKNADGILLACATGKTTPTSYGTIGDTGDNSERGDYWTLYVGRAHQHFFAGARAGLPGCGVRTFGAR